MVTKKVPQYKVHGVWMDESSIFGEGFVVIKPTEMILDIPALWNVIKDNKKPSHADLYSFCKRHIESRKTIAIVTAIGCLNNGSSKIYTCTFPLIGQQKTTIIKGDYLSGIHENSRQKNLSGRDDKVPVFNGNEPVMAT